MKKLLLIAVALILSVSAISYAQPATEGGLKQWGLWTDSINTQGGQTVDDTSATITVGPYSMFQLFAYAKNIDGTADSVRLNYHMEVSFNATNWVYFDSSLTVRKADTASYKRFAVPDSLKYYPYLRLITQADSTDGTDTLYLKTYLLMMEEVD